MSNIILNLVESLNLFCFWVRQRAREGKCGRFHKDFSSCVPWITARTHVDTRHLLPCLWCCPLFNDQNGNCCFSIGNLHFHVWIINKQSKIFKSKTKQTIFVSLNSRTSLWDTNNKEREKERKVIAKNVCVIMTSTSINMIWLPLH